MLGTTAGCGGTMDRHSWLLYAMVDMATYAELNGLAKLHQQLCHLVSTAATGELAGCMEGADGGTPSEATNVVQFDGARQQSG